MRQLDAAGVHPLASEERFVVVRCSFCFAGVHAAAKLAASDLSVASIELVAQHWAAEVGRVHADLMSAAGFWQDFESRETGEALEDIVKGGGIATGGVAGADGHLFALVRMNANRLRDQIAVTIGHADGDGEILLFRCAGFEL